MPSQSQSQEKDWDWRWRVWNQQQLEVIKAMGLSPGESTTQEERSMTNPKRTPIERSGNAAKEKAQPKKSVES